MEKPKTPHQKAKKKKQRDVKSRELLFIISLVSMVELLFTDLRRRRDSNNFQSTP
jgi:hypothetical protein